ncbi:hypothetical protein FRB99_000131 [Tulasnella sp. 403]|nr:hypothetical protein FRB99_000131 [Tulasnella sp. 403]
MPRPLIFVIVGEREAQDSRVPGAAKPVRVYSQPPSCELSSTGVSPSRRPSTMLFLSILRLLFCALFFMVVSSAAIDRTNLAVGPYGTMVDSVKARSVSGDGLTTNAKRIAAGLPPFPPARRTGTLSPRASPVPVTSGTLRARRLDGTPVDFGETMEFTMLDIGLPRLVAHWTNSPLWHPGYYIGTAITDDTGVLQPGTFNYVYLTATSALTYDPRPVVDAENGIFAYESAIWLYHPADRSLTLQWINADGTSNPVTIFSQGFFQALPQVGITGDYDILHDKLTADGWKIDKVVRVIFMEHARWKVKPDYRSRNSTSTEQQHDYCDTYEIRRDTEADARERIPIETCKK